MPKFAKTVYLIPCNLGTSTDFLSPEITDAILACDFFFCENPRTTRRFLKGLTAKPIQDILFIPLDKRSSKRDLEDLLPTTPWKAVGYLSEAGLPCLADPGQVLVDYGHQQGWQIRPISGPSSILLTAMASGLNGQQFCFRGYLPKKETDQKAFWRSVAARIQQDNETQIFMDTPYRSQEVFERVLQQIDPHLKLCLGVSLHNEDQWIKTRTVSDWKREKVAIKGLPTMFALGR